MPTLSIRLFFLSFLFPGMLFGSPFSLNVEVSSLETINKAGSVSPDFATEDEVAISEDPAFGAGSVVGKTGMEEMSEEVIPSPPVSAQKPANLRFDMSMQVGEEEKSSSLSVKFLSSSDRKPILREAVSPRLNIPKGVLPPLSSGPAVLPEPQGVQDGGSNGSVLVTREGELIEGVSGMLEYMVDNALPAVAVTDEDIRVSPPGDNILMSLGVPNDSSVRREVRSERVEANGLLLDPGLAFGSGVAQETPNSSVSGFFPGPPLGYEGEAVFEPVPPVVLGGLW